MTTLWVALAGAAGAAVRYRLGVAVGVKSFPWTTLAINLSGCFVLALVLFGPGAGRWQPTPTVAVTVGFLGAYTTFSTFGYETFAMLRAERIAAAASYIGLSVVGGIAAAALGYLVAKTWLAPPAL